MWMKPHSHSSSSWAQEEVSLVRVMRRHLRTKLSSSFLRRMIARHHDDLAKAHWCRKHVTFYISPRFQSLGATKWSVRLPLISFHDSINGSLFFVNIIVKTDWKRKWARIMDRLVNNFRAWGTGFFLLRLAIEINLLRAPPRHRGEVKEVSKKMCEPNEFIAAVWSRSIGFCRYFL